MTVVRTRVISRTLTALLSFTLTASNSLAFKPEVGKPLAGFTLPRIDDGEPVSLSDYRGRKLLLIMFASW